MRIPVVALVLSLLCLAVSPALAKCPGSRSDAVELANQADALRAVDLDGAIAKYKRAYELAPTEHRILGKLGLAYMKKESWTQASASFERALELAPTFANYAAYRGAALSYMAERGDGSWDAAASALQTAVTLDAGDAQAHFDLAVARLHQGDEQRALVHFNRAVQLAPDAQRRAAR